LYGSGAARTAETLGITEDEARRLKRDFLAEHRALEAFADGAIARCRTDGHVTTLLGRRRRILDITSVDEKKRRAAERQAVNTVCQRPPLSLNSLPDPPLFRCAKGPRRTSSSSP